MRGSRTELPINESVSFVTIGQWRLLRRRIAEGCLR